jgi:hypothetical protein
MRYGRVHPFGTQFLATPTVPTGVLGSAIFQLLASGRLRLGGFVTQFARPSTDVVNESWEEDDGTTIAIFDQIDEETRDDTDFIQSALAPSNDVYTTKASPVTDPQQSAGHTFRCTYGKDSAGGSRIDCLIELRQAYVSEGNQGTLIATMLNAQDVGVFPQLLVYTLSASEADAITDYTDLYFRYRYNQV